MLVVEALLMKRWGKPLFRNMGLCLLQGSLTVLRGKGRPAKTALLEAMAGKRKPDKGEIRFEGQPVFGHEGYAVLALHVIAKNDLMPRLSVRQTIERFAPSGIEGLSEAAMRYFKLTPYAHAPCFTLPLHLQRRVAYARLLAIPCPLWFIEHEENELDEEGNGLLYTLISNRCNQDGIVVVATDAKEFISPHLAVDMDDFS